MAEPIVLYEVKDQIAYITLNRPEKLNAFNIDLAYTLRDTWDRFENDPDALVAILSGAGRAFSAGADITPGVLNFNKPWQSHQAYPANGLTIFKPIVGAIHGYAYGQSYFLAVHGCDITIAADNAEFGFPEARIGMVIPPLNYMPYMPFKISMEVLLLSWNGGRLMSAQRAYEVGIVNRVVPLADLMEEARKWAEMFKKIPPLYIRSIKYGHYKSAQLAGVTKENTSTSYCLKKKAKTLKKVARPLQKKGTPISGESKANTLTIRCL